MNKLSKEKKMQLVLVTIATAGAITGLWMGLLSLQKDKIRDISARITSTDAQIKKVQKVVIGAAQVEQSLKDSEAKLSAIEDTMPSGDLYSWMVSTLRQFNAPSYRVDLPQIGVPSVGEVRMFASFPYHAATVSVGGTAYYWDFGKFLADFENRFPYMQVQNLNLEPAFSSNPDDREKLAFRMNIVALIKTNSY
jgi:hypothetical protein